MNYNARSDHNLQPLTYPPVPAVNAPFTDPDFPGTKIVRVTDPKTMGSRPEYVGRSFHTDGSAEAQIWSSDGTTLLVQMMGNMWLPFQFNTTTMNVARRMIPGQPYGQLPYHIACFDAIHPHLVYGINGTKLQSYDIAKNVYTTLFDLATIETTPPWQETGPFLADLTVSGDGTVFSVTAGGKQQDTSPFVLVVAVSASEGYRWYNCQSGQIGGTFGVNGSTFPVSTLHNSRMSKSGQYVELTPSGINPQPHLIWKVRSFDVENASSQTPDCAQGHRALGYNHRMNPTGTKDQMNIAFRDLGNPHVYATTPSPLPSPQQWSWDKHLSWNNAGPLDLEPCFATLYNTTGDPKPTRCWDGEVIGITNDGSGKIFRFCHHRSTYDSKDFWSTPRGNVSPNGKWFAFTSNWDKKLGGTASPWRHDVFVCQLH